MTIKSTHSASFLTGKQNAFLNYLLNILQLKL